MTNAALRGKPDAGNPHVRFDGGEVASEATPRRGSLLYNRTKVLICNFQENHLDVEAFERDGKITINRMQFKWEAGNHDVGLGKDCIFDSEQALFDYVKKEVVPYFSNIVTPNIRSSLSMASVDVRTFPISLQGEIVKNTNS